MHGRRQCPGTNFVAKRDPRRAVLDGDLHLYQLVRRQRPIDFGDHAVGDARVADVHHGLEGVRTRFQVGSFLGGERFGHPSILAPDRCTGPQRRVSGACAEGASPGDLLGAGLLVAVGAGLMIAPWPWTYLALMPLNKRLLATPAADAGPDLPDMLERWNTLHRVRTLLGAAATASLLWAALRH
jgi:hypothetical protein